ncbi:MAG: general secretion pathway protein GspK [Candidatus Omnitrophica bacterium]|nr:general secretion pathway protein GspK [Candidatus Omnitrophota bacterium]
MKNKKGSVLVASVFLISILSITAASLGFEASQHTLMMKRELQGLEDKMQFQTALSQVKEAILSDPFPHEDSLQDKWYIKQKGSDPSGLKVKGVRPPLVLEVEDEESKINLNFASEKLLKSFFEIFESQVEPLVNADKKAWIKRLMEAREKGIGSLDELYLWNEIPVMELAKILPYITVAPTTGQINLNTASPLVLEAYLKSISGDEFAKADLLKKILEDRQRQSSIQSKELTPRDFTKRLDLDETPQILSLVQLFLNGVTTDSAHYRIKIKTNHKTAEAVIKEIENFKFEVLSWHEE